ncbi:MAG: hypothetical protein ACXWLH_01885 [Candidatus Saccharimonadales bacterium]
MNAPAAETQIIDLTDRYLSVDDIPLAALARDEVRRQAWAVVRQREQLLADDHEFRLPLTIDALSTARHVNQAEEIYGEDSPEYLDMSAGLQLDCLRLVAEWHRKLRPEYFPKSRHFFDASTGDFYSHGLSIRQMTENALRPVANNPEEVARRVNEKVENETPTILKKIGGFALEQVGLRTISECTDKAITDYQSDIKNGQPHAGYDGYVPEIEKVMIRDIRLETDSGDRLEEQIGLPGIYINHFVIQETLRRQGVETGGMDKTALHGNQLLVQDDLITFVRLLDEVASEEWCVNIFMGEVVDANHPKPYQTIRQEAKARQAGLKDMAATAAVYIRDLEREGTSHRQAPAMVEKFVKALLLDECKKDIELTHQIFDQKTADGLKQVAHLEAIGQFEAAQELFTRVESAAPGGGSCGGGSCGLESISPLTDAGKDLAKLLKAESGDLLVKDKERACRKCNKKEVVYAYNKNKVNKYCQACQAFESKITK